MPLRRGTSSPLRVYRGGTLINRVYRGAQLTWQTPEQGVVSVYSSGSVRSRTLTLPSAIPSGGRLWVFASCAEQTTATIAGLTFTTISNGVAGAEVTLAGWWANVSSTDAGKTVSVTWAVGSRPTALTWMITLGHHASSTIDVVNTSAPGAAATSYTSPAATTSTAAGMEVQIVAGCVGDAAPSTAYTVPAAFTDAVVNQIHTNNTSNSNNAAIALAYGAGSRATGATIGGDSWGLSTRTARWAGITLAVRAVTAIIPPTGDVALRVNCGSSTSVPATGGDWVGDDNYLGIPENTDSRTGPSYPSTVYQTHRVHPVGYRIPITNGYYEVDLLFAEPESSTTSGQRVTHWYVNGVYGSVDVTAEQGQTGYVVETAAVKVTDGLLDIRFYGAGTLAPTVCGIEVRTSANKVRYGPAFQTDGPGNLQVGTEYNYQASYRFTAEYTGNITAFRGYWLGPEYPGYGDGTGGTIRVRLTTDDNGVPSATTLGYVDVGDFDTEPKMFSLHSFLQPVAVTKGTVYHLWFENIDSRPDLNYVTVNCSWLSSENRSLPPTFSGDLQPGIPYSRMATLWTWSGGSWQIYEDYTPIIEFTYSNSVYQGQGYMETEYDNYCLISNPNNLVREQFTYSGESLTVHSVAVRLAKASGSGDLVVTLKNSGGTLATASINTSTLPVVSPPNYVGGIWLYGDLSAAVTLTNATSYSLELSTTASTSLWTNGIQKGASYGFTAASYFADGYLQVSANNGSSWATVSGLGTDGDLPFFLYTTGAQQDLTTSGTDVQSSMQSAATNGTNLNLTPAIYTSSDTITLADTPGSVTIDGQGSVIEFSNRVSMIRVQGTISGTLTVKNLTLRHNPIAFTQGTVTAKSGGALTVAIDPGYPDPAPFVQPNLSHAAWFASNNQWKRAASGVGDDLLYSTMSRINATTASVRPADSNLYNAAYVGDRLALPARDGAWYPGLDIYSGQGNVVFENVRVQGAFGLGSLVQIWKSGTVTYRWLTIEPPPRPSGATRDPLISSNYDGLRGYVNAASVRSYGSHTTRMTDDGCNWHGYPGEVVAVNSSTQFEVNMLYGFANKPHLVFNSGQTVRLMDKGNKTVLATRTVSGITSLGEDRYRVTVTAAVSAATGQVIDFPGQNTPGGEMRGCYDYDHAANHVRIRGDDMLVWGCRFDKVGAGYGIDVRPYIWFTWWQETGWTDGVTIQDNYMTLPSPNDGIYVGEDASTFSGHTNLDIRRNKIVKDGGYGINLNNCDGVTLRDNVLVGCDLLIGTTAKNVTQGGTGPPSGDLLQGDSGLHWNTIMFGSGDITDHRATFETWMGHPLDGMMWFVPRSSWGEMLWLDPEGVSTDGYKVICVPTQPETQDNSETASGSRNWWWEEWGAMLADEGLNTNRTIIRLNWECNAGAWYPWTWDRPGVSQFVAAWTNAAKSIRRYAPNVLFNLNHSENNFSNAAAGGRTWAQCTDLILPYLDGAGKPLLNIVGIDSYNHSPGVRYPASANAATRLANWYQQTNRTTGDFVPANYDPPTRGSVYRYATERNQADGSPLWFWHDEYGASHSEWNSGGDDPYFFEYMWDWFYARRISNGGRLLGECIYNDPGDPSSYQHQLMDWDTGLPTTENYNGALKYKQLWQPD